MGGFAVKELFEGKVAGFNLWSHSMSEEELNSLSCDDVGDLVGPSNFYYSEAAQKSQLTQENFECGRLCAVVS